MSYFEVENTCIDERMDISCDSGILSWQSEAFWFENEQKWQIQGRNEKNSVENDPIQVPNKF